MSDSSEFLAEAQELIDGYSQRLLAIEAQLHDVGAPDPDLLNGAFRALHTLKSLAAMVGHKPLGDFSHELESTLDRMRLGKLTLDLRTIDLLFESAELCEKLLNTDAWPAAESFLRRLAKLTNATADLGSVSLGRLDDEPDSTKVAEPPAPAPAATTTSEQVSERSEQVGERSEQVGERSARAGDASGKVGRQTVRVDLRKLDLLMNLVGELAVVHTNLESSTLRRARADPKSEFDRELLDQLRIMNRRLGLLQQEVLGVRMVPIGGLGKELALLIRDEASKLGKEVRFSISGADTELDKRLIEKLKSPLMHMVRNAIGHGIEMPADRVAAGKPRAGHIAFAAFQKGNRVVIELIDDGAGIDWRRVRDKAIQRGFLSQHEAQSITPAQAINVIFKPGFSTRETTSGLAGRGVGMDVVKTEIAALSGMVDVASEPGRGSRFRIIVPITLAIIQALVLDVAGQTFCIPLNSVIESIMVRREELQTIGGHEVVPVRGRTLPLISLAQVFEIEHNTSRRPDARLYVVIVGLAQHRVGLIVDELLGEQDVVIKPIGTTLGRVPGIAGATELGNNRTVLVLDVASLVSESIGEVNALTGTD